MAPTTESQLALHDLVPPFEIVDVDESHVRTTGSQVQQHRFPETQASLPAVDGGKGAWLFLAGSFFIEALVWGFPFSFGVFQDYYSTHEPFSNEQTGIAVIGTSAMGIMYLGAPFTFAALQTWPKYRRYYAGIGLGIIAIALVASSFSTRVWHLILTQGVLYAIGGTLLYTPTVVFLDEWFIRKKGFAYGVMWAGTGVSGVCVPLIMNWGLGTYGHSTMLRIWAITVVILSAPLLYYVKPRIPLSMSSRPRRLDMNFLRTSTFWTLQVGNIMESLGFFIPNVWLPTYARSIGLSSIAASLPLLCIFSLVYGLFAGGFTSTWTGVIREVQKRERGAEAGLVFGLLSAGRGVGSVLSGPLSEALLKDKPWAGKAGLGYGTGYGGLIVFTGISAILGGFGWIGRRVGWV
ncbi:hypothetical protein G7Y79_00015g040020 [Physcia stellaris]|nr:hypothetical protein G7Y79_00015g040020 [Physcia stellaris]